MISTNSPMIRPFFDTTFVASVMKSCCNDSPNCESWKVLEAAVASHLEISVNKAINQLIHLVTYQLMNQSITRFLTHSLPQSINQVPNQSIDRSVLKVVTRLILFFYHNLRLSSRMQVFVQGWKEVR